jgi:MinD superfamily P-loop ATPase
MKIAIASGKGGTGKTTVSVNLFYFINRYYNSNVQLVDCDVEEPNDVIFFRTALKTGKKKIFHPVPKIDLAKCTFCRKCSDWCQFNAISIVQKFDFAEINKDLCHSCGACLAACNFGAISEYNQALGTISHYDTNIGKGLTEGKLEIGSAMQTSLIKQVKKNTCDSAEIIIYDAPPGTSCPVVETVVDADFVILVTEPTPFGLHDLKITIDLLKDLKKPFGVIVNKTGIGSDDVFQFLEMNHIQMLGKIPFTRKYAAEYSTGNILQNIPKTIEATYFDIIENLMQISSK